MIVGFIWTLQLHLQLASFIETCPTFCRLTLQSKFYDNNSDVKTCATLANIQLYIKCIYQTQNDILRSQIVFSCIFRCIYSDSDYTEIRGQVVAFSVSETSVNLTKNITVQIEHFSVTVFVCLLTLHNLLRDSKCQPFNTSLPHETQTLSWLDGRT